MFSARVSLLALGLAAGLAGSASAEVQRFVVIANGEKVGHLIADVQGRSASVDYAVSNNGRGPKAKETIAFDASGVPVSWSIDGSSLFGSPVQERFAWSAGKAAWTSQADKGEIAAARPILYAANDASPWMLGVYVKALLKAPNHTLPLAPAGEMRLKEVRKLTLGEGEAAVPVTVYELSGIDLSPSYVLIDAKGELFGTLDGGLIREGAEGNVPALQKISREIDLQEAMQAQAKLAHRFETPVRIRNVRVFDPKTMTVGGLSTVIVFKDRITTVEPQASAQVVPAGETVIDGQGGTLVPGLHDMHSHTTLQSNLFNLAAGVTAVRDQGNVNEELLGWIDGLETGKLAGPRIVRNGFLEGRSPYSARHGFIADSLDGALKDVRWYADHGYWQIKIYNSMNPDWVAPIAAEAHRLGMGVTGHVPAFSSPDRVIKDGYNDIAHINQLMLGWIIDPQEEDTRTPLRLTAMARAGAIDLSSPKVQTTLTLMQEKRIALDTTAMILERLMLSRSGQVQEGDAPYLSHVPIGYQRYRKRNFVTITNPQQDADYHSGFAKVLEVLKLLDDRGIQLLPGTDDGTGFSLQRELEVYVKAGISPAKTLRLATLDSEAYFGRDHSLGSIERGKLADFILVDGDPTQDISNIRKVRMTMVGGVAYYPAEIYEHLNVKPFAAPPPVRVAK